MDLRKFKNTEVLIPQKKSKVLDITYQYASVTELDDNGEIYPIGEKVRCVLWCGRKYCI